MIAIRCKVVIAAAALAGGECGVRGCQAQCAPQWNTTIGTPGMDNFILSLFIHDDGSGPALYAGGGFQNAGGVSATGVARWSGGTWAPLASGIGASNGSAWAFATYDDNHGDGPVLFVGGDFAVAGGILVNRIGRWDGRSWSALGTGLNAEVRGAMTVFDDGSGAGLCLYMGGDFTTAGGVTVNRVARWDGVKWSGLAGGVSGVTPSVRAMAIFDDGRGGGPALYIAGGFTSAGGLPANRIARWNGQEWSTVGGGLNSWVRVLYVFDDGSGAGPRLFAGGDFTVAGEGPVNRIACWDGRQWSPVGGGMEATVRSLLAFDDGTGSGPQLHACGDFTTADGLTVNGLAKWDGRQWIGLGAAANSIMHTLLEFDDGSGAGRALYVGGMFTSAAGTTVGRIISRTPCVAAPADLNGDGHVTGLDLAILLAAWGRCPPAPAPCPADLDHSGAVNGIDLAAMLAAWG